MCKAEEQPSHDCSAHHRNYVETGSQVKFSQKLVSCVALEWSERIDSNMHLFGFQELLKTTNISINVHFNFKRPDTCTADTFSFNNSLYYTVRYFNGSAH